MKTFFCVLGMVVTALLGLFCALTVWLAVESYLALNDPNSWMTTEGRLTGLELSRDNFIRKYEAEIECDYVVDGDTHISANTERMSGASSSDGDAAKREVVRRLGLHNVQWEDITRERHKAVLTDKNSRIMVSYHPAHPSNAFYEGFHREKAAEMAKSDRLGAIIFAVLGLLCAGGFYGCLRALRSKEDEPSVENPFDVKTPA